MEGSCNCKEVTFVTSKNIKAILNCHCNLCRKMNGSAFSTYVVVPTDEFSLVSGTLTRVQVSENASKSFCATCGTPIYNENPKYIGLTIIHLGALDNIDDLSPAVDTFCESQLEWIENMRNLTKLEKGIS
ncbi:GFA family protein [Alteromonas sp. KUL49]|uniref:GFA family protein n=1 Tax=Alteromonas sp. KUL49 TaxID=2480798 RepID=UPI00102F2801|nr:GFA family protein [Alteromonas sp. KUL49]TAP41018.1 GFA family protein [Alteromonas sp. KUL49]GEA11217.1 hypothetical protein KUL49_15920 [Alteromonas sp. KUL49]